MTDLAARPAALTAEPDAPTAGDDTPPEAARAGAQRRAEVALCAVTVALACGFARLFDSAAFLPRLLLVAVAGHAASALARRTRRSVWVTAPLLVALGALVLCWLYLRGSLAFGLPTGGTIRDARALLTDAFAPFRRLVAPVPINAGFEVTMAAGVWVLAVFADQATFLGEASVQALVPHAAAFAGSSVFARHRGDVLAAAVLTAAVLVFVAARQSQRAAERHWVEAEHGRGGRWLFGVGAALALVSVSLAALAAPELPGAHAAGWIDLRSLGRGPGPVRVGNPLVGVGNLLGARSDDVLFTVRTAEPHYWRQTALELYDPATQQWRTERSYAEADSGDRLPGLRTTAPTARAEARFELSGLPGIWLPAPFRPTSVEADVELRFDADSASVIAAGRTDLPDLTYEVVAAAPIPDAESVRDTDGGAVDDRYLADPQLAPNVLAQLRQVTNGSSEPLGKLRALQDWFRSSFLYNPGVDYSREVDPTASFLEARSGFCQQFASTFAVMARALGIPARIAVGFTYGTPTVDAQGRLTGEYEVRGRHAHAWPEVYLGGVGWVPFEPTPGRGNPDAEQLTGVERAQDDATTGPAPTTTTTTSLGATRGGPTTTAAARPNDEDPRVARTSPGTAAEDGGSPVGWALLAVLAAVVCALAGRVAWIRARRRRRRGAGDPPGRVRAAWLDSLDWLEVLRVRRSPQETPAEFSSRASRVVDVAELRRLADLETIRLFGDRPLDDTAAAAAEAAAAELRATVVAQTDFKRRLGHLLGVTRRG